MGDDPRALQSLHELRRYEVDAATYELARREHAHSVAEARVRDAEQHLASHRAQTRAWHVDMARSARADDLRRARTYVDRRRAEEATLAKQVADARAAWHRAREAVEAARDALAEAKAAEQAAERERARGAKRRARARDRAAQAEADELASHKTRPQGD